MIKIAVYLLFSVINELSAINEEKNTAIVIRNGILALKELSKIKPVSGQAIRVPDSIQLPRQALYSLVGGFENLKLISLVLN